MNKYDLEERTSKYGSEVITFIKTVKLNIITKPLVSQLVRSSTSIGANYMEANGASSKRDFKNKIHLCKKESKETMHWLTMLSTAQPSLKDNSQVLWQEAKELSMIFSAIIKSSK